MAIKCLFFYRKTVFARKLPTLDVLLPVALCWGEECKNRHHKIIHYNSVCLNFYICCLIDSIIQYIRVCAHGDEREDELKWTTAGDISISAIINFSVFSAITRRDFALENLKKMRIPVISRFLVWLFFLFVSLKHATYKKVHLICCLLFSHPHQNTRKTARQR